MRKPWTEITLGQIWRWLRARQQGEPAPLPQRQPARLPIAAHSIAATLTRPSAPPSPNPLEAIAAQLPYPDPLAKPPGLSPRTLPQTIEDPRPREHLTPRMREIYGACDRQREEDPGTSIEGYRKAVVNLTGKPCAKDSILRWKRSRGLLAHNAGGGKPGRRSTK
jgi:hypothetical protein